MAIPFTSPVDSSTEPGVLLTPRPFASMSFEELAQLFDPDSNPAAPLRTTEPEISARGLTDLGRTSCVRRFLPASEGTGYWDYFKPAGHFLLSVAEVTYCRDEWIPVEDDQVFKLRLLLSGALLNRHKQPLLVGPQAMLHLSPRRSADGYFVAGGSATRLVVLHCQTDVLTRTMRLEQSHVPAPLCEMFEKGAGCRMQRIAVGPEAFHAAQRIVNSRHGVPSVLRAIYLESMAQAVLCEVLSTLSNHQLLRNARSHLSERDLNAINEVREYLTQHFRSCPTIPQIARMVGINQTKLKQGFRQVMGVTIYQYVLQRRMERAAELLATKSCNIAEVAYAVGYEYSTNFTSAFKRYFGHLPRGERS